MTPTPPIERYHTANTLLSALPKPPRHMAGSGAAADFPLRSLCSDSRKASADSLFICIRGAQGDGHRYASAAYRAGCRVFLMEQAPIAPLPPDAHIFLSDDTHRDLALLCAAFYGHPAKKMKVIGITGTKGKTTVAMMCYHILKKHGISVGYIGTNGVCYHQVKKKTLNTTPGSQELQQYLFEMQQADVQVVLLEVSSQGLWQRRVDGIPFAICAMTNLYPDHIGAPEHPDFDHYAACKRRLLTDYGAPVIIGNADDAHASDMLDNVSGQLLLCSLHHTADLCATHIENIQDGVFPTTAFICQDNRRNTTAWVHLPLPGEHNVQNALFAISIVCALGLSLDSAATALSDVRIPGRFEMLHMNGALVVIDYAHNGEALRAALTTLRTLSPTRLFCLFGSVGGRTQCRRAELGKVASELADHTYLTADNPDLEPVTDICLEIAAAFTSLDYTIIPDRTKAIVTALNELKRGDILLIAGKGDEHTQRIGGKEVPHRDRDVVEQYMETLALPV